MNIIIVPRTSWHGSAHTPQPRGATGLLEAPAAEDGDAMERCTKFRMWIKLVMKAHSISLEEGLNSISWLEQELPREAWVAAAGGYQAVAPLLIFKSPGEDGPWGPRVPKMAPQDGSKMAPRWPQDGPERAARQPRDH
eukprot:856962-Pyramimonas_sp.AAC.1